ncbi:hypothetical protein Slin15195_G106550 [Septoria linicola]|uniref:Uncharacterized protein n=1 Tax=Septoria linicola TaxID=215465 RepID=A0A9Q9B551_9PEZI|nr:hypothetical protein Slin14017_G069520 [Septoria linicola]USW57336.1 hypothetical protein Slin15195_G106550 [Septoria linicola]
MLCATQAATPKQRSSTPESESASEGNPELKPAEPRFSWAEQPMAEYTLLYAIEALPKTAQNQIEWLNVTKIFDGVHSEAIDGYGFGKAGIKMRALKSQSTEPYRRDKNGRLAAPAGWRRIVVAATDREEVQRRSGHKAVVRRAASASGITLTAGW